MRGGAVVHEPRTARGRMFLDELRHRIDGSWVRPSPRSSRFAELRDDIVCQSSPSKLALLEAAAATLRSNEVYLEIGSFHGASTVAAARARDDVHVVAIDDFSFGTSLGILRENLERYGVADRVTIVEGDCFDALRGPLPDVGVYLFDGPHTYMDQYLALELGITHLTNEALVIVDDTRWAHVARANADFIRSHKRLTLLCDLPSKGLRDEYWWNGIQVFEFITSGPQGGRDLAFQLNRARDFVFRPMTVMTLRHRLRASLFGLARRARR